MTESERYQSIDGRLYIDVGNSRIKAALLTDDEWKIIYSQNRHDIEDFRAFCELLPGSITEIRVASVIGDFLATSLPMFDNRKVKEVTVANIKPKYLDYNTVSTLGIDRFLACLGAWHNSRDAVVVVDAGTACTIDFMDKKRVFHGGYITPGLLIREKGLHEYAPSLPNVVRELPELWPGRSTKESIQWGLTGGFVNEIRAAIQNYRRQFGELHVWLTGGDAAIVDKYMPTHCQKNNHLVFEGMRVFPSVEE